MATVPVPLWPGPVERPTSNAPRTKWIGGTNTQRRVLAFDGTVAQSCTFTLRAAKYGSGSLTVRIRWSTPSPTTSGDVVFGAAIGAVTPNIDSTSLGTKALGAAATVTDSHLGTTADRLMETTITVASLDALAPDDYLQIKFYRDAANVSDTINGVDVYVETVDVEWSDT